MKTIIQKIVVSCLMLFPLFVISQNNTALAVSDNDNYEETTVDFTTKYYDGKVYLNWTVQGQKSDCAFLVLRSFNKSNYQVIGFKKGSKADHNVPLLYCYIDSMPLANTVYYKVKTLNFEDPQLKINNPNNESRLIVTDTDQLKDNNESNNSDKIQDGIIDSRKIEKNNKGTFSLDSKNKNDKK